MPKAELHLLSAIKLSQIGSNHTEVMLNDGGGLYLYARQYGAKEWIFRFTSPVTNKRRKQSLGSYPDTSLKEARKIAAQKREAISNGLDPLIEFEKHLQLEAQLYAENVERKKNTVKAVFQEWKDVELKNRKDKGVEIERAFEKDVFPLVGNKIIGEVTRNDIKAVLSRPLSRKSNRMANRLLSDLKQFFGFADDEELITNDPTRRLTKERIGGKETPKERYLSHAEIQLLHQLLPLSGLKEIYIDIIWVLLATGCRVNEILRVQWKHIDLECRTLLIPSAHAKNSKQHIIHLSDFALFHLLKLKEQSYCAWLVPDKQGKGPVNRQTLTNQVTDRQPRKKKLKNRANNEKLKLPGGHWVIHDLRRTAATIMQELNIMPHIIKKCLNQKPKDRIEETYQRAELQLQQQTAFDKLGHFLNSTINANPCE